MLRSQKRWQAGIALAGLALPGVVLGQDERETLVYYDFFDETAGRLSGGITYLTAPARDAVRGGIPANWTTTLDNGDPANRIDLVTVGDGYTAAQLSAYATHAANWENAFLTTPPFSLYQNYFNFHRVDVISAESGVDHDPTFPTFRNTALGMGFWCNNIERLLCVNVGLAYQYANNAPDVNQVIAIANSTKYGGAGYPSNDLATLAGGNNSSREIALHELGHSLGNLADEYHYSDGATYTGGEPSAANLSRLTAAQMTAGNTKWFRWLDENNPAWDGLHSTFVGGGYYQFGLNRPTDNSKMRSLGRPFNHVSAEALIAEIYRVVDPIDESTPNSGPLTDDVTIFVVVLQPTQHNLDITWLLNGTPIANATGPTLDLAALGLAPGSHTVTVQVVDNTPLVRNPAIRSQFLTQTRTWQIEASACLNLGDLNCDGFVTVGDVAGFVLALTDPAGYAATYPDCDIRNADMNCDGFVTVGDIGLFVSTLVNR